VADERAARLDPMQLNLEAGGRAKDVRRLCRALIGSLRLTWAASRKGFIVAAALQVTGALAAAALVVVGQLALESLLHPEAVNPSTGVLVIVSLAAVTAAGSAATGLQQQQQRLLGEEVSAAAWQRVLDVAGRVELEYYEAPQFYDQLERVKSNAVMRPIAVTTSVFGLLGGAVGTASLLLVLLSIDPLLVPVLLLAGIPSVLLTRRASLLEFRFIARVAPIARGREYLRRVLTGRDEAKEVRAFGSESALRSRHDDRSDQVLAAMSRHVRTRQRYALGVVVTMTIALSVSLALLVWFLSMGRINVADAGAAALGIRLLSTRLEATFSSVGGLLESSVFLDDLDRFFHLAVPDGGTGRGHGPPLRRAICVENVSYNYPGAARSALHEVSLVIGAGEVIAIVGENGSGKTTLAKVIAGLYAPTSGRIRWDATDAADLAPADVRRSVAVIFQDFVRYQLSARENIGLGDPEYAEDLAAAQQAARRAGAADFLEALPNGYDTVLSKEFAGGTDLSVGQWQRVALARALRRDAPLVILDEPSSALDPRAEQALFADVRAMLQGRAAVLISHRYSTVRSADRIFVMREGRILEAGSHDSLMAADGPYAELFSLQAKAYR
jgi:ATP-binding cassette, subfamily B, bacterial